jgi:S-adenosylmethionine decarboxylase
MEFVGRHVMVDATVSNIRSISAIQPIYDYMEELARRLDMTLVYPPIVAKFPFAQSELEQFVKRLSEENVRSKTLEFMEETLRRRATEDSGVSGVSIWLESHCTIHTWPEESFFSLDAYSCKDFDPMVAFELTVKWFGVEYASFVDVERYIGGPCVIKAYEYRNGRLTPLEPSISK